MKQLFKSIAAIALVATFFASCSKDSTSTTGTGEVGAPTLSLTTPTAESNLRFNDVLTLKFTASAATGAKLKSVLVTRTNTTSSITSSIYGDSTASVTDSATINRTVADSILGSNGNVGDKFIYTIIVTDNKGKSATTTAVLNIKDLYTTGQFLLGAQSNTTPGQESSFFGLNENAPKGLLLYRGGIPIAPDQPSKADSALRARYNSANIDFGVYYGTANRTTIFSPSLTGTDIAPWATELSNWGTKNKTFIFRTTLQASIFSGTNFNIEQEIDKINFSLAENQTELAKVLLNDNVVAFKTASGAKGLMLIITSAADAKSFVIANIKWKR
ncbi:MAG: hypothetical protein ACEQSR_08650 [Candidatus Methylacidiphilales bacterium]